MRTVKISASNAILHQWIINECTPMATNSCIRPFVQIRVYSWVKSHCRIWLPFDSQGLEPVETATEPRQGIHGVNCVFTDERQRASATNRRNELDSTSGGFAIDAFQELTNVLERHYLSPGESDAKTLFHGKDQVDMGQRIPAIDIIRRHFRLKVDLVVVKNDAENSRQFFNGCHGARVIQTSNVETSPTSVPK